MAPKCYICKCYDPKIMSLFRIPNRNDEYSERGSVWLKLLNAKKKDLNQIRICSLHFLKKKPCKDDDYLDVDWVPNKNLGEYANNWKGVEYFIRKKNASRHERTHEQNIHVKPPQGLEKANSSANCISYATTVAVIPNAINGNPGSSIGDDYLDVDWVPNKNLGEYANNWKGVEYFIRKENASRHERTHEQNIHVKPPQGLEKANSSANCISYATTLAVIPNAINENPGSSIGAIHMNGEASRRVILSSQFPLKKRKLIEIIEERTFFPKEIQTELTMEDVDLLFERYQCAVDEREQLLLKLSTVLMDFNYFKENDKKTRFFTGLSNWKLLVRFFDLLKNFIPSHFNCKLSQFQMLVLTLMKLRLNATFTDLGYRFQIDGTTASKTFHRCIFILFKKLKNSKIVHWPEERKTLIFNTPSYFGSVFKENVTIIIDCFEIFSERASSLRAAAQLFSVYKHHATLKYLIGISMSGVIIFISKAFGGRTSDKEVTMKSGFLSHLQEDDLVLADKGFLIKHEVEAKNAHLKMPCFVRQGNQLHPIELETSRKTSSLRIHVERVINILRQKFNICSDVAKMSAISKDDDLFGGDLYDMIVFVCASIVNICPSVVTSDFEI